MLAYEAYIEVLFSEEVVHVYEDCLLQGPRAAQQLVIYLVCQHLLQQPWVSEHSSHMGDLVFGRLLRAWLSLLLDDPAIASDKES